VAGRGQRRDLLAQGFAEPGDPLQAALARQRRHILGMRPHDNGPVAVGADLERILAPQFEQKGDALEHQGNFVAVHLEADQGRDSPPAAVGKSAKAQAQFFLHPAPKLHKC